jgi:hypothetical protein
VIPKIVIHSTSTHQNVAPSLPNVFTLTSTIEYIQREWRHQLNDEGDDSQL